LKGTPLTIPVVYFNNDSLLVGINEKGAMVYTYELNQNYPNPFNPSTLITYSLKDPGNVTLKLYNALGQEVVILVNQFMEAGNHTALLNANSLSSGVYFYKIETGSFTSIKKMILLK